MHGKYPIQIPIEYHEKKHEAFWKMEHWQIPIGYFEKKWHKTFWKMKCVQVQTFFFLEMLYMILWYVSVLSNILIYIFGCFHHLKNR